MATARTAARSVGMAVDGLARLCDLAAHPVPTCVARGTDGRKLVVERLALDSRPSLARDAASLSRLHHPNLVHVRKVVPSAGDLDLVTDYVEGESLAELLRSEESSGTRLPLEVKLRVVVDVLNGLSALHGHRDEARQPLGLFHAHVAPSNMLVGIDGATRLIHLLLPARAGAAAQPGEEAFVAPELAKGDGDARTDIFSVGVLLDRAVRAATPGELAWASPFADVARRAMLPERTGRFTTAAEMAAEVRKIAKAKLASPMIVAAAVDEIASEHIEARKQRMAAAGPTPPTKPAEVTSAAARPTHFQEEPPTVPRKAAPELLRLADPIAPTAPLPIARAIPLPVVPLPPPPPKPAPPVIEPTAIVVIATAPPIATVPLQALTPAQLIVEDSETAIELDMEPDAPSSEDRALPALSPSQTPPASFRLGGRERRRGIVFGVLGVAVVILIVAVARNASHGSADQAAAATRSSEVPAPSLPPEPSTTATVAIVTPPPLIPPEPTPSAPVIAAAPPATVDTPAATSEPPPAPRTNPVPTARARRAGTPTPAPKTKPGATYDPLGI